MKTILRNWKTSLLGTGALSAGVVNFANNPDDLKGTFIMLIIGLVGLFASDGKKPPVVNDKLVG